MNFNAQMIIWIFWLYCIVFIYRSSVSCKEPAKEKKNTSGKINNLTEEYSTNFTQWCLTKASTKNMIRNIYSGWSGYLETQGDEKDINI